MQQLIVVIVMLLTGSVCWGQNLGENHVTILKKKDSVITARAVKAVNSFELSAIDKEKIAAAAIRADELRKVAINKYIKTASFQKEFNKAIQYLDSVYLRVLGKEKFMQFKAGELQQRDAFENAQRQRYKQQLDSLSNLESSKTSS